MTKISSLDALEILDSRGNPTLAVYLTTEDGVTTKACVPSGASTGEHEAIELRDQDKHRYLGKGVQKAVANVRGPIAKLLQGKDVQNQREIDHAMVSLDGTPNKAQLGANAILGVSLAVAKAAAQSAKLPLYRYLHTGNKFILPCPMMNIINGGAHADNQMDFQEFMIRPIGAPNFHEAIRWGVEVFFALKSLLKQAGMSTSVGDEGGFAPNMSSNEQTLDFILKAIEKAGYRPKHDISLALDCAASEFYDASVKRYIEMKKKRAGDSFASRSAVEQVAYLETLCSAYPIDSIEDGMDQNDWNGWVELTSRLGKKIQIVGDDLFVTNSKFIEKGVTLKAANSVLIKINQIGTLTETIEAVQLAKKHGFTTVFSHRSGETEDTTISDLSVALNAGQIKTGSLSRSDRVAKYNRLLEIEHELGSQAIYGPH